MSRRRPPPPPRPLLAPWPSRPAPLHAPTLPALSTDLLGPAGEFGHREHVRLAWRELRAGDRDDALQRSEATIRHVAAAHGAPDKYHRTITEGWAALVAHHLAEAPELGFDEFCARF